MNAALVESLEFRNEFLQSRIDDVENCKDIVKSVIAAHAHALANGLVEEDLLFKRSVLSPEVLIAVDFFVLFLFVLFIFLIYFPFFYSGYDCNYEHQASTAALYRL